MLRSVLALAALFATLAQPVAAQDRPVILVHYMPWFQARPYGGFWGWHWTMDHFNPEVLDAEGHRQIASHVYPLIGPYDARDPDVLEYHTLLMKVAGVDGVVVDWYGTSNLYDYPLINAATDRLFQAVEDAGLRFAVCYEDATLGNLVNAGVIAPANALAQAQTDLAYVRDRWASDARYLTYDDAPVVFNFGPQYLRTSAEWEAALRVFSTPPHFVTQDHRLVPVGAGAFPWPPMWASVSGVLTPDRLGAYLDAFYDEAAAWPLMVGGAFPGFHDIYEEAGVGPSYGYLDHRNGATFSETLQRALDAGVPLIQIATWNDFGEGTAIEPAEEYGYRYLEHLQAVVQGWRALPYTAADLPLPHRLFELRKRDGRDPETTAQLDAAAAYLAEGRPAEARALLDLLMPTAAEAPPEAEPVGRVTVAPHPAHGVVRLLLEWPMPVVAHVEVFDATGRVVARLAEGMPLRGRDVLKWDAGGRPSGLYFVRISAGERVLTRPVVVLQP